MMTFRNNFQRKTTLIIVCNQKKCLIFERHKCIKKKILTYLFQTVLVEAGLPAVVVVEVVVVAVVAVAVPRVELNKH